MTFYKTKSHNATTETADRALLQGMCPTSVRVTKMTFYRKAFCGKLMATYLGPTKMTMRGHH